MFSVFTVIRFYLISDCSGSLRDVSFCPLGTVLRVVSKQHSITNLRSRGPSSASAGERSVLVCVLFLYTKRKLFSARSIFSPSETAFLMTFFTVLTAFSAAPLLDGWYGAIKICLIPLRLKNASNFWDRNGGPPSLTKHFGSPNLEKHSLSLLETKLADVPVPIRKTSIHLE